MPESSLFHDFVVKDKENVDRIVDVLTKPKKRVVKPTKSISGKKAILQLMRKWRKGQSRDN